MFEAVGPHRSAAVAVPVVVADLLAGGHRILEVGPDQRGGRRGVWRGGGCARIAFLRSWRLARSGPRKPSTLPAGWQQLEQSACAGRQRSHGMRHVARWVTGSSVIRDGPLDAGAGRGGGWVGAGVGRGRLGGSVRPLAAAPAGAVAAVGRRAGGAAGGRAAVVHPHCSDAVRDDHPRVCDGGAQQRLPRYVVLLAVATRHFRTRPRHRRTEATPAGAAGHGGGGGGRACRIRACSRTLMATIAPFQRPARQQPALLAQTLLET